MSSGLIIIDVQNDYFGGGNMELSGMDAATAKVGALLQRFRDKGRPTFHIQHIAAAPQMPFFQPDTEGVKIHESIQPLDGEVVVTKHYPNSFRESTLQDELDKAGVDEVVICGAMSHMCVDATTRHAGDSGLKCVLIHDACATRDLEFEGRTVDAADVHASYMAALAWGYANAQSCEEFLSDS